MKNILLALCMFLPLTDVYAQNHPQIILGKPKATTEDYEKHIKKCAEWCNNLTNPEHWKDIELTHKETKNKVQFKDLSILEKKLFYFISGEKLANDMAKIYKMWTNEIENTKLREKNGEKEISPTSKQLEDYVKQIFDIRKKVAVKFESIAEDLFKSDDRFTEDEKIRYLQEIKKWNKKENLID